MASFAKLVVSLGANISSFETDMKRATSNQGRRMKEMERQAKAAGVAVAAAFTAIAGATVFMVRNTANAADEIQKLSQQTGISAEVLSGYKYAAEQSGTSLEALTKGINKMQRSVVDAATGLRTQERAFERLGLSVDDLLKMTPDKQFEAIAEALSKMENATLRNATSQEIMGRSAVELLSLTKDGAEGIRELTSRVELFNATISQEFADNAATFNDNLDDMRMIADGAAITFTEALLPSLLGVQNFMIDAAIGTNDFSAAGEKLGKIIERLIGAFILFKGVLASVGTVLVGVVGAVANALGAIVAPVDAAVNGIAKALGALKAGNLVAASNALKAIPAEVEAAWQQGVDGVVAAIQFIPTNLEQVKDDTDASLAQLADAFDKTRKPIDRVGDAANATAGNIGELNDKLKAAREKYATGKIWDDFAKRLKAAGQIIKDTGDEIDDLVRKQEEFESSMKSLIDTLYPMEAQTREFITQLENLREWAEQNKWSADQLADAEIRLANSFAEATRGIVDQKEGLDFLQIAMDETARILTRTFQTLFEGIVDDSLDAWDAIESGFTSLAATIAQTPIKIILDDVQKAFSKGGGGFGALDFSGDALGGELVRAAGAILGLSSADTIFGQLGSSLGSLFGETLLSKLGTALFPKLLAGLGSFAGPIGTALGAILGSALGDLVGGLFERKLAFTLGGANAGTGSQNIRTPLGQIVGISGQGGFGSLNDSSTFGGQLAKALTEFDTQIAEFLKGFASDEQFSAVTRSLENWVGSFGEGADAADVLSSRFRVILGNFSGDIQTFVNGAADFEEQLNRFGVALTADKLLRENPELFSGRTTGDILTLVSAFQSGAETMEDAFREFLTLFSRVAAVSDSLRSFANSNLAEDFAALGLDLTTAEALARVNSELMDAVATFDGSVDSFERIGTLAMLAREGELKLLSEIDAIQKGINSNLDKLKADILGINAPDATGEQLFLEAQKLIGQITDQSSAADLAALEQQFNSIIRSIAPEDQLFMQSEILALIETFRARANPVFDARRNETLDNAQAMREMVDGFLVRIGDPLDIIAASLDGVNLQETMNDGLNAIDESVQQIGPQVAAALAQGLSQVSFTINLDGGGLVTQ